MADRAHLHRAAQRGDIGAVRALVQAVDVNIRGGWRVESPLHAASRAGRPEVIACLMEAGAHTEVRDRNNDTPLLLAAWLGHALAVRKLLVAGARVDAEGIPRSALHCACMQGHTDCVRELLRGGADELAADEDGNTPLHVVGTMSEAAGRTNDLSAIRHMLDNAPADRAWRRRAWLAMLRVREFAASVTRPPLLLMVMTRSAARAASRADDEGAVAIDNVDVGDTIPRVGLLPASSPKSKRANVKNTVQRKSAIVVTRRSRGGRAVGHGERRGTKRPGAGGGGAAEGSSACSPRKKGARREKGKVNKGRGSWAGEGHDPETERRALVSLVGRVIGLGEEGAFRCIVSFL